MRCVGAGTEAQNGFEGVRISNFGRLQQLRWESEFVSAGFYDFEEGGGVCLISWACVHVCTSGMCTVLGLKDKG